MALDINKLHKSERFEWYSKKLGKILVHGLSTSANESLRSAHPNPLDTDSNTFVRSLITLVCQLDLGDSNTYTDKRITTAQARLLTDEELNQFARKFLEKNSYLVNDTQSREDTQKTRVESNSDKLKRVMFQYQRLVLEKTNINKLNSMNLPEFHSKPRNLLKPNREIDLPEEDVATVFDGISQLKKFRLKTDDLFGFFTDWQTKKTLTSKRIFVSTSLLVTSASWVGIDISKLTLFGLKVTNGSPTRFICLILGSIILSGIFYFFSRKIDASVRKARIIRVSEGVDRLKEPVKSINHVIKRNNIKSFSTLYYDFTTPELGNNQDYALDAYNFFEFYNKHLSASGTQLNLITKIEQFLIYVLAACAIGVLVCALYLSH